MGKLHQNEINFYIMIAEANFYFILLLFFFYSTQSKKDSRHTIHVESAHKSEYMNDLGQNQIDATRKLKNKEINYR